MAKNYTVQGGIRNYMDQDVGEIVSDLPRKWKSASDHPETMLAYITHEEAALLVQANLHSSPVDKPPGSGHGPNMVPSYNGWGWGDADEGYTGETGGSTEGEAEAADFADSYYSDDGGWDFGDQTGAEALTAQQVMRPLPSQVSSFYPEINVPMRKTPKALTGLDLPPGSFTRRGGGRGPGDGSAIPFWADPDNPASDFSKWITKKLGDDRSTVYLNELAALNDQMNKNNEGIEPFKRTYTSPTTGEERLIHAPVLGSDTTQGIRDSSPFGHNNMIGNLLGLGTGTFGVGTAISTGLGMIGGKSLSEAASDALPGGISNFLSGATTAADTSTYVAPGENDETDLTGWGAGVHTGAGFLSDGTGSTGNFLVGGSGYIPAPYWKDQRSNINFDKGDTIDNAPPPWNQSGVFTGTRSPGSEGFPDISQKTIDAASFNAANAPSVYDAGYGVGDQRSGYISPYPAPLPVSATSLAPPQAPQAGAVDTSKYTDTLTQEDRNLRDPNDWTQSGVFKDTLPPGTGISARYPLTDEDINNASINAKRAAEENLGWIHAPAVDLSGDDEDKDKDKVFGVNPIYKRGGIVGDDGIGYGSDSIERLIDMATDPTLTEPIPATAGALMQGVPQPGGPAPTMAFRNNPSYVDGGVVAPGGPPQAGVSPQGAGAGADAGPLPMQQMEVEMQRMMQDNPQEIAKMKQLIEVAMQSGDVTREELNMAVQLATAAAQNPQLWPQLRQFAIQQGLADEQDLPPQYDQGLVFAILLAAKAVQATQGAQGVPQSQGQPPQAVMRTGGETPASNNADGSIAINAHEGEGILHQGVMKAKGKDFLDKLNSTYEQDGSRKERSSASANV